MFKTNRSPLSWCLGYQQSTWMNEWIYKAIFPSGFKQDCIHSEGPMPPQLLSMYICFSSSFGIFKCLESKHPNFLYFLELYRVFLLVLNIFNIFISQTRPLKVWKFICNQNTHIWGDLLSISNFTNWWQQQWQHLCLSKINIWHTPTSYLSTDIIYEWPLMTNAWISDPYHFLTFSYQTQCVCMHSDWVYRPITPFRPQIAKTRGA